MSAKTNRTRIVLVLVGAFAVMATGRTASLHPVQTPVGGGSGTTSN